MMLTMSTLNGRLSDVSAATTRRLRKPARRYHHGDLRRALLEDAVQTIATDGVAALTLREAGRRLGVSRTALYRHFSDKSALLAAVAREGFQRFAADLERAWLQARDTPRGLELMGAAYIEFAVAHPAHYRVMFGQFTELCDKDPELQRDAAASFAALADALATLQKAGVVRRDEPLVLARYIWSVVHGIAMLAIDGQLGPNAGGRDLEVLTTLALERLQTGIAA
jgi:AcrR family transcriptional regulator